MSSRSSPLDNNPTRALNLQKYLLLHSEHEAIRANLTSLLERCRPNWDSSTFQTPTPAETVASTELWNEERKLHDVNQQIKTALTDLLNCESVRRDRLYRAWVQRRLMEAEKELKEGRRMSGSRGEVVRRFVGQKTEVVVAELMA